MNISRLRAAFLASLALSASWTRGSLPADRISLDFEGIPGMANSPGTPVPAASRLSDQYLSTSGVAFSSSSPYVAVVDIDRDHPRLPHAPSPVNAIGGVLGGALDYGVPITAEFFLPDQPTVKAVTDFVQVAADHEGSGSVLIIFAFAADGSPLGSSSVADVDGPVLAVSAEGIHSVTIQGTPTTAFDDFTFDPVEPVLTDCNRNGIDDSVDLRDGTSRDADGNGVPDECDAVALNMTLEIEALIDGRDLLIVQGNSLQWHHLQHAAVGRVSGGNEPTVISTTEGGVKRMDRVAWVPVWPSPPPDPMLPEAFSSAFTGLTPRLPDAPQTVVLTSLSEHSVGLLEAPSAENDYTLVLDFDDRPYVGASVHRVRVAVQVDPTFRDCNENGQDDALDISSASSADTNLDGIPDECQRFFHRGDPNADGRIDISDPIRLLRYLFMDAAEPGCAESSDANDDGTVDISDPVHLLGFLFLSEEPPPSPGPVSEPCGVDPDAPGSPGDLGCVSYPPCGA